VARTEVLNALPVSIRIRGPPLLRKRGAPLCFFWRMFLSENRYPLFRNMR
jgi:hypothetical protein